MVFPSAYLAFILLCFNRVQKCFRKKHGVNHFIVVVDFWRLRLARVISPGLSPHVLRFHIFDIEPPSVTRISH
jgi:hypothetical protein